MTAIIIFSGLANLIPYVGPSIGLIPMIISNLFTDPHKMIIAVIYMLIIQQVDGNILYPRIVGGVMKVHPITILVLLLLSSNIYGVIGMIVAVPTYSILKEIAKFLARLYENHKEAQEVKIQYFFYFCSRFAFKYYKKMVRFSCMIESTITL